MNMRVDARDDIYKPTPARRTKVKVLVCARISEIEIARRMGIEVDTLRKYYANELQHGGAEVDGDHILALHNKIMEGSVAAFEAFQRIKKHGLLPENPQQQPVKEPKLGKKEMQKQNALNPSPDTNLGDWMLRRQQVN